MKFKTTSFAGIGIFIFVSSALAHHTADNLDFDTTVELSGTVTDFQWTNPYTALLLTAAADGGETREWLLDLDSPGALSRRGWDENTLEPGDEITVTIHPLKMGLPGGRALSIELPDGTVVEQ